MVIDKVRTAEELSELGKLPKDYAKRLKNMNIPVHLRELLVKVITMLLHKIDMPQDDVDRFVDKMDERGASEMLALENYSVQETRRQAKAEAEAQLKFIAKSLLDRGNSVADVAAIMGISESKVLEKLKELV